MGATWPKGMPILPPPALCNRLRVAFDMRKSLPLTFGTHQGKEIVIASILCNVGDVLFHRLRLIVRKPLEDGAEGAALPDTATDISCEKQRFMARSAFSAYARRNRFVISSSLSRRSAPMVANRSKHSDWVD